jgi:myo-inositol 2-dehydrogenase/D-chiro-inositol 1-dehydrogenase
MHAQVAMQVLQRGIPVFVEKPPAGTLEDAIRVAETAKANNTWGMVAFMKRFAPANIVAKEFMASAEFGALSSITLIHGSGPYNDLRPMLYFNGIHMIDLARFFGGEIIEVFAYAHRSLERAHAISATFQFAEGGVGQFNLNSGHTWQDCFEQVYLSGTKAGITIDASRTTEVMSPARHFAQADGYQLYGWVGRYAVSGNMAGWEAGGHYTRGYWGELQQFARSLTGQAEPVPSLADGVKAIQLIEAILTSVETHQPVVLARDALPLVAGATQ